MFICSVVGQQFIDFVEASTAGGTPVLVAHNGEGVHMLIAIVRDLFASANSTRSPWRAANAAWHMQQPACPLHRAAGERFDVPFLKLELQRCGLEAPSSWLWADSLKFARKQWPEVPLDRRYGLQLLRAHFGLPAGEVSHHIRICMQSCHEPNSDWCINLLVRGSQSNNTLHTLLQAHRAMADVELLRTVFLRMLAEKTGQEFNAEGLVGLFTSQWAGSITDIGETRHATPSVPWECTLRKDLLFLPPPKVLLSIRRSSCWLLTPQRPARSGGKAANTRRRRCPPMSLPTPTRDTHRFALRTCAAQPPVRSWDHHSHAASMAYACAGCTDGRMNECHLSSQALLAVDEDEEDDESYDSDPEDDEAGAAAAAAQPGAQQVTSDHQAAAQVQVPYVCPQTSRETREHVCVRPPGQAMQDMPWGDMLTVWHLTNRNTVHLLQAGTRCGRCGRGRGGAGRAAGGGPDAARRLGCDADGGGRGAATALCTEYA
jgi:hypothetical protein